MAEGYIFGKGGGLRKGAVKKGTVVVTYPSGVTCTVDNGSKTYEALDTSGLAAFIVDAGDWTVTISQTGQTPKTKSVTVTVIEGKYVEVVLSFFDGNLYNAGNEYEDITGGWGKYPRYGNDGGSLTSVTLNSNKITMKFRNAGCSASFVNKISLKGYSKLNVDIEFNDAGFGELYITTDRNANTYAASLDIAGKKDTMTLSFNPATLTEEYYIGIAAHKNGFDEGTLIFTKVWLS